MKLRSLTLDEVRLLAVEAWDQLNGRNGDPSKRASWSRERKLAGIVIDLVNRLDGIHDNIEVEP